jgi:hypothetical protein
VCDPRCASGSAHTAYSDAILARYGVQEYDVKRAFTARETIRMRTAPPIPQWRTRQVHVRATWERAGISPRHRQGPARAPQRVRKPRKPARARRFARRAAPRPGPGGSAAPSGPDQVGGGPPCFCTVFNQPKPLPITTVPPPLSQVVRSTPLGMACSELPGYGAPRPGLLMSLRLRFCPQYRCLRAAANWADSGYSPGIPFWEGLLLS